MLKDIGLFFGIPGFPKLQTHVCRCVLKVSIIIISAVIRALRLKICFKIWDCFGGYQDFPSYKIMYTTVSFNFSSKLLVLLFGPCVWKCILWFEDIFGILGFPKLCIHVCQCVLKVSIKKMVLLYGSCVWKYILKVAVLFWDTRTSQVISLCMSLCS